MGAVGVFFQVLTVLIVLPVGIYMSWLLYNHIHATDLMWFLWWFYWPLTLVTQLAAAVAKNR